MRCTGGHECALTDKKKDFYSRISSRELNELRFLQGVRNNFPGQWTSSEMKKLFQKAKLDYKFKRAGEGHALQEESSTSQQSSTPQTPAARASPTSDAQRAGQVHALE